MGENEDSFRMKWNPMKDKYKYGVVVNNFDCDDEQAIKLTVGHTVHILEDLGDWYFGYVIPSRTVRGVFPKSFIHIKDCVVDRTGQYEVVTPRIPPIIQELTAALREWGLLIKDLYIHRCNEFQKVYDSMNELISLRNKMLSGQLLVDEIKQIKHHITDNIDLVNRLLGLDLVVRDEQGNILNPDITSTVKLFRHHKEASEKLNKTTERPNSYNNSGRQRAYNAWTIMLNIKNVILKVPDICDVSLAFYMWDPLEGKESRDGREGREKLLTEPYIFTWTPDGYRINTDLYMDLVALYTDLSSKVIMQDKQIFLMGTVIREGSMVAKEVDKRTSLTPKKTTETNSIRRPFGLFIVEVSDIIKKQKESALENTILNVPSTEVRVPFYPCGEKDSIDALLRKCLATKIEVAKESSSNLCLVIDLTLFNGDIKQLRKENPNYTPFRELPISFPLCMSDIVVPGDVRNDLYVTLLSGEFGKVRNVEVVIKVCDDRGVTIPDVIYMGSGKPPSEQYRSVTYLSEPKWMETFKVALPIEEFKKAHLKFIYRHRSANEMKDKNEKPFAMSFVKLIQPNGTTLMNMDHELIVYKIDPKKWSEQDSNYLKFPCVRLAGEDLQKMKEDNYSLSLKDSFLISTMFCSTKLTQKVELLSLLQWAGSGSHSKTDLRRHLSDLRNVPPDELIIFLQDTLHVLFDILMKVAKDDESISLVFEALVDIIYMAAELNKHESYQSVLETYIRENFYATLAYDKLVTVFRNYIDDVAAVRRSSGTVDVSTLQTKTGTLNKAMKCLQYLIKFIIRSRRLFTELHSQEDHNFQESLFGLLSSMAKLMTSTSGSLLPVQGLCLKYLPATIPDIMSEFDNTQLCVALIRILNSLKDQRLSPQRLTTMCEIVHSQLFLEPSCRALLLEAYLAHIKKLFAENEEVTDSEVAMRTKKTKNKLKDILGSDNPTAPLSDAEKTEELKLSVKILCDVLDILFGSDVGPTLDNLMVLLQELLQDILAIISKMRRDDPLLLDFVAVLISLLRQIPEEKFLAYLEDFPKSDHLQQNLSDILMVVKDLIENPVFPVDWSEMILLKNYVLKQLLSWLSKVIMEKMKDPFVDTIWNNFFHTSVTFITQPCLQLEKFTPSKRTKILTRYKDLRRDVAKVIKQLWFSLGRHKIRFIVRSGNGYSLVGPFLEMTMLPEVEIRRSTIPIFFDMMQCEFYSTRGRVGAPDMAKVDEKIKGKFDEFERDMLEHLDHLIEGGCGDEHYKEVFVQVLSSLCKEHSALHRPGLAFVSTMGRLMEKLLQYRTIMNGPDHSPEIRMSCTVSLLDFYAEINRKELYLRYVYKLFDLHCECDNFTEAGYTIQLHANLLSWNHSIIPGPLKCSRNPNFHFQDDLKEKLYHDVMQNFEKGKMWEAALKLCKELVVRYEEVTLEYDKLPNLLSDMAKYYKNVMDTQIIRPEPEYFRVAYYGRGFPAFLQNKVFIYRGNGFERLSEFQSRILDPFPNAEVMKTLSAPSQEQMESAKQFIQINKVDPVPDDSAFTSTRVAERIRTYHRVNHVSTFSFSRPFHRGKKDSSNEFATLWTEKTELKIIYSLPGVLRCFPVSSETKMELTPLDNALVTMMTNNDDLERLIRKHVTSQCILEPLTRKVSGMVDAAVMGGIKNYEKAFLTSEYLENSPEDEDKIHRLKILISEQVPLLELALEVHGCSVSTAMSDLHIHLLDQFKSMKAHIQSNYGASPRPSDLDQSVQTFKRQTSQSVPASMVYSRSSQYSIGAPESNLSNSIFPRISLAVKSNHSTLPRGIRLSSSSSNFKKDKKGFKYLRSRRDSVTSKNESNTEWFEPCLDDGSPHGSPVIVRDKKKVNDVDHSSKKDSSYFSRPESFTPSVKSNSSSTSLHRDSGEVDQLVGHSFEDFAEETFEDRPPPLPAKNRQLDLDRISNAPQPNQDQVSVNGDHISGGETPPQKPPRPDLALNENL